MEKGADSGSPECHSTHSEPWGWGAEWKAGLEGKGEPPKDQFLLRRAPAGRYYTLVLVPASFILNIRDERFGNEIFRATGDINPRGRANIGEQWSRILED